MSNQPTAIEITKPCPVCGQRLVLRTNRKTQGEFIGCSAWPACEHHEPLPEYMRMRALGAETLPGF